ncbi:conserved membrane hypothetical protein [uncultured delta proteobacterium]|uniref:TRAP C4-dicarboxylate transport system permease DctM subunit domain-containing protein n=1 Tax=uncultured delta proteobacterium TaxID=34034 RepID=A0A212JVE6_9DELT|nr:conserved membrane hypothetical protein [uncultured delta proteobacterium]
MTAVILVCVFAGLLSLNVPIAISLGMASIAALLHNDLGLAMIPSNVFSATSKFALLAVPFFILAGNIMEKSGISHKLIDFAQALVGHRKCGLALVCVVVSCFFAAISGSGPATVAALGTIIIPAMIANGYRKDTSSALMASAGAIGIIIPPSITFVIFGAISGTSIGKLFMAGVIPGLLVGLGLAVAAMWASRNSPLKLLPKASTADVWRAFKDAFWGLMMPVIILGGIYGGIFTPTEAAAISAVYGFAVGFFIYRTLKVKEFYDMADSLAQTAVVMFIMATASLFAWVMTVEGVASASSKLLVNVSNGNPILFLMILNVLLLAAGCVLDTASALYIFAPIYVPAGIAMGVDPVHLGVISIVNLAIGLVTPPVGVNLFMSCGIGGLNMKEIAKGLIPFLVSSILALLAITYIPWLSLFLPGLM